MKNLSSLISLPAKASAKSGQYFSQKGFTLVELLLSMGLLTIILGVLTTIFGSIIDVSLESRSASALDQDARFVMARLSYDMQRSDQIVSPSAPSTSTSPSLTMRIGTVDYTYDLDGSGNLRLTTDTGEDNLNSSTVEVSNLTFQRLGVGDATDTVQVKFDLTSRVQRRNGYETESFQTTIGGDR
jgi:prepilin-type N-terminal cleavage/methylation domain-containing protein